MRPRMQGIQPGMLIRNNDNKKLYDKPQTPGVYLFGRMAGQRNNRATFGGPQPKLNLQAGREAFRNINFSKFKAQ